MLFKVLEKLDRVFGFEKARAHCDIPCGIYDPHQAQIGALTVIRMIDLMTEMKLTHAADSPEAANNMPRYVLVKEEHAELVKREIRVIFGDYIKQEQLDKFPRSFQAWCIKSCSLPRRAARPLTARWRGSARGSQPFRRNFLGDQEY